MLACTAPYHSSLSVRDFVKIEMLRAINLGAWLQILLHPNGCWLLFWEQLLSQCSAVPAGASQPPAAKANPLDHRVMCNEGNRSQDFSDSYRANKMHFLGRSLPYYLLFPVSAHTVLYSTIFSLAWPLPG